MKFRAGAEIFLIPWGDFKIFIRLKKRGQNFNNILFFIDSSFFTWQLLYNFYKTFSLKYIVTHDSKSKSGKFRVSQIKDIYSPDLYLYKRT